MKKVTAMLLTLVMAVSFCIPSAAFDPNQIPEIILGVVETIQNAVDTVINDIQTTIEAVPEAPQRENYATDAEYNEAVKEFDLGCEAWVNARLGLTADGAVDPSADSKKVFSRESLSVAVQLLVNRDSLDAKQQESIEKAIKKAAPPANPGINFPANIVNLVLADTPQELFDALKENKIPLIAMKTALKALVDAKIVRNDAQLIEKTNALIDQKQKENAEDTKGGITDTISGVINGIKDLFGLGGGDNAGDDDASNSENGMQDPTGDVAIFSVLGVAAVAGAALVLTRKKKED